MTSRQKLTQAGFTLVELAIVLLIVGLLIAGILKGQELIENSRTTATVQQTKAYEAAVNTFRDSYGALPGDISSSQAQARLPGCSTATNCVGPLASNGIIGTGTATAGAVGVAQTSVTDEIAQFWLHLALANLITVVQPNFNGVTAPEVNKTNPAGRLNGVFTIGYANGTNASGTTAVPANFNGHYLSLQGVLGSTASAAPAITPARASQIDLKLDDGQPAVGDVLAMTGTAAACYTGSGVGALYNAGGASGTDTNACSLAIRVMN